MIYIVSSESTASYFERLSEIQKILEDVNRDKTQPIPLKIKYKSSSLELNKEKPFIIIFGEQHPGSSLNQLNFAKTNRALLNGLIALSRSNKLELRDFIKEGCSELKPYEKLASKSIEELLVLGLSPLQVFINKVDTKKKVITVESEEIFTEFALLSLLYASRPGNARFRDLEMQRIIYLISEDINYEQYLLLKSKTQKIIETLNLTDFIEEKYLKKVELETDYGVLKLIALRANIEEKLNDQQLKQFDLRIAKALFESGKERDYYSAEQAASLEPGLYPMFFGDYHINNLIQAFQELEVPVLVISPF